MTTQPAAAPAVRTDSERITELEAQVQALHEVVDRLVTILVDPQNTPEEALDPIALGAKRRADRLRGPAQRRT